jgi:uncharacterized protein YndB with AHSA1/START domain
MTHPNPFSIDPRFDLVLERVVDVPRELVWLAWTTPEHLKQWFTPVPWTTVDCQIDLRPGGVFSTVMRSPEGKDYPHSGCYLEVVKNERLVWTDALQPGFRPSKEPSDLSFYFTASITLAAQGKGTKYTARVMHKDEESRKKHDDMGFHEGWGIALDQLVAAAKNLRA